MKNSYWKTFEYNNYLNSELFNDGEQEFFSNILKSKGKKISDLIFKDPNVLPLIKQMPKQKKEFLLDFETSKPFNDMSLTTVSSHNLVAIKQIYGEDLFNNLVKDKTYVTFKNIGLQPLVLMALYAQHYPVSLLNNFFRG